MVKKYTVRKGATFSDPVFQGRFLEYVAHTGASISAASRHFGVSSTSFHEHCRKYPEFRLAYEDARAESADRILAVMREQAEMGDVQSAALYLKHVAPPTQQRVEVQHDHRHELSVAPESIQTIRQLQAQLEQRALPSGSEAYIDGEEVD